MLACKPCPLCHLHQLHIRILLKQRNGMTDPMLRQNLGKCTACLPLDQPGQIGLRKMEMVRKLSQRQALFRKMLLYVLQNFLPISSRLPIFRHFLLSLLCVFIFLQLIRQLLQKLPQLPLTARLQQIVRPATCRRQARFAYWNSS